jgi:G3E family GTPase
MATHDDQADAAAPAPVPFTILTGWLGAGKTTVLNRMLGARHGRKIAVLVNELGRISIDTRLILSRGNDVLELAGGCVCCKVDAKSDLWDGIADVIMRSAPEHVVLETTGIAEPAAILDGLSRVPEAVRARIAPAGVICIVDGEAGAAALHQREEAREQASTADRIMLSKLDIARADDVAATHAALDQFAPNAERASFTSDDEGGMALTHWVLEPRIVVADAGAALRPQLHTPHHHDHEGHHHHSQLIAASFVDDVPLLGDKVLDVLRSLGASLVRAKGFVLLAGTREQPMLMRGFVEHAGVRTSLNVLGRWHAAQGDGAPRTELVIIGDNLDEAALRRALWACRAGWTAA